MQKMVLPAVLAAALGFAFAPSHARAGGFSLSIYQSPGTYYPTYGYAPVYVYPPAYPVYTPPVYDHAPRYYVAPVYPYGYRGYHDEWREHEEHEWHERLERQRSWDDDD